MNTCFKTNKIKISPVLQHTVDLILILAIMLVVMKPVMADPININKENVEALQQNLEGVGVGPVKAQAIVDYRKKNTPLNRLVI